MKNQRNYRHGFRRNNGKTDRTYQAWRSMKARCLNPKNEKYGRYGGRGISICRKWLGRYGFNAFLEDLGEKPSRWTLGRINNDGNYTPSNCRWETQSQQAHNRSTTVLSRRSVVTIYKAKPKKKRTQTVNVLARRYGICRHTIYKIWDRSNWAEATAGL